MGRQGYGFLAARLGSVFVAVLVVFSCTSQIYSTTPSPQELMHEVLTQRSRVLEFEKLEKLAQSRGLRVFLFGGAAATYANYVRLDLLRRQGDTALQADRFEYTYDQIYKSIQDLDLGVSREDGSPESVAELMSFEATVRTHLPGIKIDVYGFKTAYTNSENKPRENLIQNFNLQNQNSDSLSNGLIELTQKNEILDIRSTSVIPLFIDDLANEQIHFLESPMHFQTRRAEQKINPPLFSVIRYFIKLGQFNLKGLPSDEPALIRILNQADTDPDIYGSQGYVRSWLTVNSKKLILGAEDIQKQFNILDHFGLSYILVGALQGSEVALLLSRKPLLGLNAVREGRTAQSLGLRLLTHETTSLESYESIMANPRGRPNFLISNNRENTVAAYGTGVYAKVGTEGAAHIRHIQRGYHIHLELDPTAIEGVDFEIVNASDFVILKNSNKVRTVYEPVRRDPVRAFVLLANSIFYEPTNLGTAERTLRRLANQKLSAEEENKLMEKALTYMSKNSAVAVFALLVSKPLFQPVAKKIFLLCLSEIPADRKANLINGFLAQKSGEQPTTNLSQSFIGRMINLFDTPATLVVGAFMTGAVGFVVGEFGSSIGYKLSSLASSILGGVLILSTGMYIKKVFVTPRFTIKHQVSISNILYETLGTRASLIDQWLKEANSFSFSKEQMKSCRAVLRKLGVK